MLIRLHILIPLPRWKARSSEVVRRFTLLCDRWASILAGRPLPQHAGPTPELPDLLESWRLERSVVGHGRWARGGRGVAGTPFVLAAKPQEGSVQPADGDAHGPALLVVPRPAPGPVAGMRGQPGTHRVLTEVDPVHLDLLRREQMEVVVARLSDGPRQVDGPSIRGEAPAEGPLDRDGAAPLPRLQEPTDLQGQGEGRWHAHGRA
jgi:hypothetical protein